MALQKFILSLIIGLYLSTSIVFAAAVSERQATKSAAAKYQAKVLAVKSIKSAGTEIFKIKLLLDNGRIKTVYVDSSNGKISDSKP